jgi:peptidyl-tRNA hydrolase
MSINQRTGYLNSGEKKIVIKLYDDFVCANEEKKFSVNEIVSSVAKGAKVINISSSTVYRVCIISCYFKVLHKKCVVF